MKVDIAPPRVFGRVWKIYYRIERRLGYRQPPGRAERRSTIELKVTTFEPSILMPYLSKIYYRIERDHGRTNIYKYRKPPKIYYRIESAQLWISCCRVYRAIYLKIYYRIESRAIEDLETLVREREDLL